MNAENKISINGRTYEITGRCDMSKLPEVAKSTRSIEYIAGPRGAVGALNTAHNGYRWVQWMTNNGTRIEAVAA